MPLLRRLLTSALVVVAASALCVCAALASARPLVAKRHHPRLAIVHRVLAPVTGLAPGDSAQRTLELRYRGSGRFAAVVLRVKGLSHSLLGSGSTDLAPEDRALLDEVDAEPPDADLQVPRQALGCPPPRWRSAPLRRSGCGDSLLVRVAPTTSV